MTPSSQDGFRAGQGTHRASAVLTKACLVAIKQVHLLVIYYLSLRNYLLIDVVWTLYSIITFVNKLLLVQI